MATHGEDSSAAGRYGNSTPRTAIVSGSFYFFGSHVQWSPFRREHHWFKLLLFNLLGYSNTLKDTISRFLEAK